MSFVSEYNQLEAFQTGWDVSYDKLQASNKENEIEQER